MDDEQQHLYACGFNGFGQLGCGDREPRVVPWLAKRRDARGRVDLCGSQGL